jgi:hypothetical protein
MTTSNDWLYAHVHRVPKITNAQISRMRHIFPVLRDADSSMFRRIAGSELLHPKDVSFLWDAEPIGEEFTVHTLPLEPSSMTARPHRER